MSRQDCRPAPPPTAALYAAVAVLVAWSHAGCRAQPAPETPAPAAASDAERSGAADAAAALTDDEGSTDLALNLLVPAGISTTSTPKIRWTRRDDAATYELLIDDSEECTSPLTRTTTPATWKLTPFLQSGTYYACVTARDRQGDALATASASFVIRVDGVADPQRQNAFGGSGGPLTTPDLGTQVLMQEDWNHRSKNRDNDTAVQNGVNELYGIGAYADANDAFRLKFFVNDRGNHRVLIFNKIPDQTSLPDIVVGQDDFAGNRPNGGGGISARGFDDNTHVSVCPSGRMLITDRGNNRVLVYDRIPTENGASADFVLGQSDFDSNGAGISPANFNQPYAAFCLQDRLLVVDRNNNRVVVFSQPPRTSGIAADFAIGQPDLVSNTPGCGDRSLQQPYEAQVANGQLLISDGGNSRILVYDDVPGAAGARATAVLGQPSLTECRKNCGGLPTAKSLSLPTSLAWRDGVLAASDSLNHRILFYRAPFKTSMAAQHVLGQITMTTAKLFDPPESHSVGAAQGLIFDGNFLWIGDYLNRRLVSLPLPF